MCECVYMSSHGCKDIPCGPHYFKGLFEGQHLALRVMVRLRFGVGEPHLVVMMKLWVKDEGIHYENECAQKYRHTQHIYSTCVCVCV